MTGGERFLSAEKMAPWIQPPKRDQKVENNPQAIQTKTTGSGDHQCVPHPPPPFQDKFNRDFERLFFSNLNRTIDHNTAVLITTEVTCIGLLDSIDHELCRRRDSPTVVGGGLHSFINRLKINQHCTVPPYQY